MLVEVCANSLESALNAEKAGADRIELCSELAVGGITPSYGLLQSVKANVSIPVRVLIRPRSGNFTYSDAEFEIMKNNIRFCAELGFEGIAIGMLRSDLELDIDRLQELVEMDHGLKTTFHRAFDWVPDPLAALNVIATMGMDTLLTSGQRKTAAEGLDLLLQLRAQGTSCMIMPGSGVNVSNAYSFKEKGFQAIHLSGTSMRQGLDTNPKVPMNSPRMLSDIAIPVSKLETLQAVVASVK